MFKKINKMYTTLFGNYNSNECVSSFPGESNRPIVNSVSQLEYQVKEQTKFIEAIMDYMNVHSEWVSSQLGEGRIVMKKNK